MKRNLLILSALALLCALAFAGSNPMNTAAPTFSGKTAEGQIINLADYKGKVVLLDFWASWCAPCREEFPFLVKLHEKAKRGNFSVIAVNVDTEIEKMKEFLSKLETQPSFPVISDAQGRIPAMFDLKGMPTTILIDKKGVVRYRHTGFTEVEKEKLVEEVKSLLVE